MKKFWCVVAPVPVQAVGDTINGCEDQGWSVEYVSYVGPLIGTANLALKPVPVPAFAIIARKQCEERPPMPIFGINNSEKKDLTEFK